MLKYQIFTKIRPVGAEMFHEDGRTGRHDEAYSRFRNFTKAAKKGDWTICTVPKLFSRPSAMGFRT